MEANILKYAERGGAVIGICGGYQMLGREVSDPDHVEGGGTLRGLGLLPQHTVFLGEKTRTQVTGTFTAGQGIFQDMKGISFTGYEIHMGETTLDPEAAPILALEDQNGTRKADGLASGNIWGCYIHGIFDRGESAAALVNCLLKAKGLTAETAAVDWADYAQQQYDKLAEGLRAALDMDRIYRILNKEE